MTALQASLISGSPNNMSPLIFNVVFWVWLLINNVHASRAFLYSDSNLYASPPAPPLESGLSWSFYKNSCPELEVIVQESLKPYLEADITQAAGLLRLHFHDCFVLVDCSLFFLRF